MPKVSNIDKPSHSRIKKNEILNTLELPLNSVDQALTLETLPITEFNRIKRVIQIQDPENILANEPSAIRQTPMSTSNAQKSKIPRFARKQVESTKINDEVETSANRISNDKQIEIGDISKKVRNRI